MNEDDFSLDLAYRMAFRSNTVTPYQVSDVSNNPEIQEDIQHHNLIMTFTYNW